MAGKDVTAFSARVVESNAISKIGREEWAVALSFPSLEGKIHADIVDYPDAALESWRSPRVVI